MWFILVKENNFISNFLAHTLSNMEMILPMGKKYYLLQPRLLSDRIVSCSFYETMYTVFQKDVRGYQNIIAHDLFLKVH